MFESGHLIKFQSNLKQKKNQNINNGKAAKNGTCIDNVIGNLIVVSEVKNPTTQDNHPPEEDT